MNSPTGKPLMNDKICERCGKHEKESIMPFFSPWGLCNECHYEFMRSLGPVKEEFVRNYKERKDG